MQENRIRTIVKTLSWRVTATIITMTIAFFITQNISTALGIGSIDTLIKLVAYYGHERAWLRIKFGRKVPEYHI